jgi:hypothetical protein
LWLAKSLAARGEPLDDALTARTNIYRLTSLFDNTHHPAWKRPDWRDERWDRLLAELRAIYSRHAADADTAALEAEGLTLLQPLLEARLEHDVNDWPQCGNRPYGFFRYDPPTTQFPDSIGLHFANPFAPRSPFEDVAARAGELSRLLDEVHTRTPQVAIARTGTWLNSFKPFQNFFPPEWAASASPPQPLAYHYGWWGQFIDRSGAFHHKNGAHLRRTGQFPFPCVTCQCSVESLRRHLKTNFGAG